MLNAYIGRQAIYTREKEVHAYELLYRSGASDAADFVDGSQATSQVVLNSFLEIGLEKLVGTCPAFINCTRDFLTQGHALALPPERLVLEVLEDIEPDAEILATLRSLKDAGYTIALDDFVLRESHNPLLELADLIKVELPALTRDEIAQHVDVLRPCGVTLLAEKVETQEEFEFCSELGFELFQGYFLSRPNIVQERRAPASRLAMLRVLARLQDPDLKTGELEALISQDLTLSYKILRYINSAAFALPRKMNSIQEAVIYLGQDLIRHWATMILMAGIDDKPLDLINRSLIRSRMCERIAASLGATEISQYSTAGLLSMLDALMDQPMAELVSQLPLSDDINRALTSQEGRLGAVLHCTRAYERGDWDATRGLDLSPGELQYCYLEAIEWANGVTRELMAA